MRKTVLLPVLAMLFLCFSCKKSDTIERSAPKPMITGKGENIGAGVSKTIGVNGGTITSPDGRLKIDIPAGALASQQTIIIQPITNKMKTGIGNAYRLSPHGITFQKPVTLTFHYKDAETENTVPELFGIGFQKDDGGWHGNGGVEVNKSAKTITTTTTHFSDWGFFAVTLLQPINARVSPGEELEFSVLSVLEETEIPIPGWDMSEPFLVSEDRIKAWQYNGEGSLQAHKQKAHYRAPSRVPARNPEAISVSVDMGRPGTFLLVANVTILSNFRIDYLQVDESEQNFPGSTYPSRLHIYGNFGNDPGADKRTVKISPTPASSTNLNVVFWTPRQIVCDIQTSGPFSSGTVIVNDGTTSDSKILNEWVVDLMYEKVESPGGSLTRKVKLVLVLRGDADGFYGSDQTPIFTHTNLNVRSRGVINMPMGTYTSVVAGDGCGSYTVKWDAIGPDYVVDRKKYNSSQDGLGGEVAHTPTGFKINLRFETPDILKSTRTFVPCNGTAQVNTVFEPITLGGYYEEEFELKFLSRASGSTILAGSLPRLNRTGVASGLFFDAISVNPDLYYSTLTWAAATPKYQ